MSGCFEFGSQDGDLGSRSVAPDGGLEVAFQRDDAGQSVDDGPQRRGHAEEGVDVG